MSVPVCSRGIVPAILGVLILTAVPAAVRAQSAPPSFKVAYYNIQSGKGEPAMPGHVTEFYDVSNCTDQTQPLNGWGVGMVQRHLVESVGRDPRIIALGLGEAWLCGSPENVRAALGWKSRSTERNGVGLVARYGFSGAEEWIQLDTTLNPNPADTMWVLRVPVCMNVECTQSINVFSAHWYASGTTKNTSFDRQGQQTTAFLQRAGGAVPHVLVGDLNVWEGVATCGQSPTSSGLSHLRNAAYIDAWPSVNGSAEGFTGMTNRSGCGVPEGYGWKRIDYAWSPGDFRPLSMTRFGIVPAGDGAPSDHYGVIAEYPWPGGPVVLDTIPPVVTLANPGDGQTVSGTMAIAATATDDLGVTRVEIIEDGVIAHTLTSAPYQIGCDTTMKSDGLHTIAARAYDAAGNAGSSPTVTTYIQNRMDTPGGTPSTTEVVLYAKHANVSVGGWAVVADPTAAGGARLASTDAAAPKLTAALAAPPNYFEMTFNAEAGRAYRLWIRGRADRDYWGNDSVFVQFSGSVDAAAVPIFRIGTTGATTVNLEDCSGCGLSGWGWQDNGYGTGVLGPLVYFATSGPQTIRVQPREDGLSIDQIVLSSQRYLATAPGVLKLDASIVPIEYVAPPVASRMEIVIGASSPTTLAGGWKLLADSSAANGTAVGHPDAGGAKLAAALASPTHFVEFAFDADAGRSYRLWVRGRADRDYWGNDSVFVQFSDSVDGSGNPVHRNGTSEATSVNLEDASGAGLAGWGWQDNGWGTGVLGPVIRFRTTGRQTIRIQTREDGLRIDQIVLSSEKYLATAPGALKNDTTIVR